MIYNQFYPFKEMPLKFDYAALEPLISQYTMFFHYTQHYLTALEKLNAEILSSPIDQNISLELLTKTEDNSLNQTAGNVFNHEMYFSSLTDKKQEPSEYMKRRIEKDFGSMENFYQAMRDNAAALYGSGYLWLVEDGSGRLLFVLTDDHDTPDFSKHKPVFTIDLWEHSYYLDRQNHRDDYVLAVIELINWEQVENNLKDYSFIPH